MIGKYKYYLSRRHHNPFIINILIFYRIEVVAVTEANLVFAMKIICEIDLLFFGMLMVAFAYPLIKGYVKMNHANGVRFSRAFYSDDSWYRINAYGGKAFMIRGIFVAVAGSHSAGRADAAHRVLDPGPAKRAEKESFSSWQARYFCDAARAGSAHARERASPGCIFIIFKPPHSIYDKE
jgi:hypothetical protein